jgi:hypothetical protein
VVPQVEDWFIVKIVLLRSRTKLLDVTRFCDDMNDDCSIDEGYVTMVRQYIYYVSGRYPSSCFEI